MSRGTWKHSGPSSGGWKVHKSWVQGVPRIGEYERGEEREHSVFNIIYEEEEQHCRKRNYNSHITYGSTLVLYPQK